MGIIKPSNKIVFADPKVRDAWTRVLKIDKELAKHLERAKRDIMENAFCGRSVQKRLIPKEYIRKYEINNLWIYDLPSAWRLLYSIVTPSKVEIISVVLDWMDHKEYGRRFKFN